MRKLYHLLLLAITFLSIRTSAQLNYLFAATSKPYNNSHNNRLKTMEQMEREHIINVLKACNGKVTGEGGTAEKLQIPASTLFARIKKLNIHYQYK